MLKIYRARPVKGGRVKKISITDDPAIELKTIMLSGEEYHDANNIVNLNDYQIYNDEQRILSGPAIIPNKLIPRIIEGELGFITLTTEDCEAFYQMWKEDGMVINLEHSDKILNPTILKIELIEDEWGDDENDTPYPHKLPNKSIYLETLWSEDDWKMIKEGKLNGYSIEYDARLEPLYLKKQQFSYELDLSGLRKKIAEKKMEREIINLVQKRLELNNLILKDFIEKI